MRAIIIGAGRGRRLMPTTADSPKCFAEVRGKRLLDWTLDAFRANDLNNFTFIGGYQIDKVRADYPHFSFRHNDNWENNNILASLFYAQDVMDEPFLCCYSDILFTADVVARTLANQDDAALVVDTNWLDRYVDRTHHPPDDAEKVTVANGSVTCVSRTIPSSDAHGEYIGLAKFSAAGGKRLREHFHACTKRYGDGPFHEAKSMQKAYLIQLFQDAITAGHRYAHVDTPGGYIEVDTQQDFEYARENWR